VIAFSFFLFLYLPKNNFFPLRGINDLPPTPQVSQIIIEKFTLKLDRNYGQNKILK
jgi:hypothetical protein